MIGTLWGAGAYATRVRLDVPVDPDAPEAREWLLQELAKAPYQAARPTWFDRLSQHFLDWLGSLTVGDGDGLQGWLPLVLTVLAAAALVVAFLIFGMPRLNRRRQAAVAVLGENDRRSAEEMRRSARRAAGSQDWNLAVQEMYRGIARGLEERTVLKPSPGTTAHDLAVRAAAAFPHETDRLADAARAFDAVRYLGRDVGEAEFVAVADLEGDLRTAPARGHPSMPSVVGS